MLKIFNDLTREKEEFKPLESNKVKMYVCGPTVYDYSHIGHARVYVFFDVVYRYLKFRGYDVKYIQNITDIDDKIIKRANEEKSVLRNYVQNQDQFLGIKLGPKAKAQILSDIKTGRFDLVANEKPEASKFFAYMVTRFGKRIIDNFTKEKSEANREGYNSGIDKGKKALHKTPESARKETSGHTKGDEGVKANFEDWGNSEFLGEDD